MNTLIAEQSRWVSQEVRLDAIYSVVAPTGLARDRFNQCLADQKLIDGITAVKERGRELGVIGTPTFFINGKQMRGALTLAELAAAIDPLLG
jgi:protein-disulfide isomerase